MIRLRTHSPVVRFGVFSAHFQSRELLRNGRRVPLQDQPFRILELLLSRPGTVVSRDDLRSELWPPEACVGFERSLNTAMNKLRHALGDPARNPRFVETIHGRGYRFIAPVHHETNDADGLTPHQRLDWVAKHQWNRRDAVSLRHALRTYQQIVDRDPTDARGYGGMATSYVLLGDYGWLPAADAFPRAKAAALRALELDPDHVEARTALGFVLHRYEWDWPAAENEYRRAAELDPGNATAHHWHAEFLSQQGRHEEALERIGRARSLDPLSAIICTVEAWILYHARRYDEAARRASRSFDLRHDFSIGHYLLGRIRLAQGRVTEALSHASKAVEAEPDSGFNQASLAVALVRAGRNEEAEEILRGLRQRPTDVSPLFLAKIHAHLGRRQTALDELERGVRRRSSWMLDIAVDPELDALRDDPRFAAILETMGIG